MEKFKKKDNIPYILLFAVSSILLFLPFLFDIDLLKFRSLGLIGLFIINFVGSATVFLPTPAIISAGIAGNLYNPILVGLIAAIGSVLGESIGYLFGLSSNKVIDLQKHKIWYGLLQFTLEKHGTWLIVLFAFIPNPLFDGIGILAGISGFSLKRFLILAFIGRLFRFIIIATIGNSL